MQRPFHIAAFAMAVALAAAPAGAAERSERASRPVTRTVTCQAARAIDGDTIRCANLPASVRLLAIDAPELPGHCRKGRNCAPGNAWASRAALAALLARGGITAQIVGADRYGRHLAIVRSGGHAHTINLSCAQLRAGQAVYVAAWDNGRRIASECAR